MIGFIYVYVFELICRPGRRLISLGYRTHIDVKQRKMTILSPNQGSVVGKTALIGSLEYQYQ